MIPEIEIWTALDDDSDVSVGTCHFNLRRGVISTSFRYNDAYLSSPNAYAIDSSLPLRESSYHCAGLIGVLRDSAPDRWGRHLIDRRALSESIERGVSPHTLDETDYLLGVYDASRQGALRFSVPGSRDYLSPNESIPPLVDLKRLIAASNEVARGTDGKKQIKELLDAGSGSLGGARPKASVTDEGKLLLAKFSHPGDEWDVMAWEKTCLDIARKAGIETPRVQLVRLGESTALLLERFDREDSRLLGRRIPYLSAMSLVGAHDGVQCDYTDIADALIDWCESPIEELEKLLKRIALSIALHNTDDHLRNIGFSRVHGKWTLSPIFDINIEPDVRKKRVTSLYGEVGSGEIDGFKEIVLQCGFDRSAAVKIMYDVLTAVRSWKTIARRNGCKESEVAFMGKVIEERCAALEEAMK